MENELPDVDKSSGMAREVAGELHVYVNALSHAKMPELEQLYRETCLDNQISHWEFEHNITFSPTKRDRLGKKVQWLSLRERDIQDILLAGTTEVRVNQIRADVLVQVHDILTKRWVEAPDHYVDSRKNLNDSLVADSSPFTSESIISGLAGHEGWASSSSMADLNGTIPQVRQSARASVRGSRESLSAFNDLHAPLRPLLDAASGVLRAIKEFWRQRAAQAVTQIGILLACVCIFLLARIARSGPFLAPEFTIVVANISIFPAAEGYTNFLASYDPTNDGSYDISNDLLFHPPYVDAKAGALAVCVADHISYAILDQDVSSSSALAFVRERQQRQDTKPFNCPIPRGRSLISVTLSNETQEQALSLIRQIPRVLSDQQELIAERELLDDKEILLLQMNDEKMRNTTHLISPDPNNRRLKKTGKWVNLYEQCRTVTTFNTISDWVQLVKCIQCKILPYLGKAFLSAETRRVLEASHAAHDSVQESLVKNLPAIRNRRPVVDLQVQVKSQEYCAIIAELRATLEHGGVDLKAKQHATLAFYFEKTLGDASRVTLPGLPNNTRSGFETFPSEQNTTHLAIKFFEAIESNGMLSTIFEMRSWASPLQALNNARQLYRQQTSTSESYMPLLTIDAPPS